VQLSLKLMEIVLLNHAAWNTPYSLKCPYVAALGRGCTTRYVCASISRIYFSEDLSSRLNFFFRSEPNILE